MSAAEGPKVTSGASPLDQMILKIREGADALRVGREALLDVAAILDTQIEDLDFTLRGLEMDKKWRQVTP